MTEVLTAPGDRSFGTGALRRTTSHNLLHLDTANTYVKSAPNYHHQPDHEIRQTASAPSSVPSSPQLSQASFSNPSYFSTPASSVSLDTKAEVEYAEDIAFPSFDRGDRCNTSVESEADEIPLTEQAESSPHSDSTPHLPSSPVINIRKEPARDDQTIEREPSRHVDYLSHVWKEEDIWASWRYITGRRKMYSNSARLENAAWRTWTKTMNRLETVSPEALNWYVKCADLVILGLISIG